MTYRTQLISTAALIGLMSAPAWAQSQGNPADPGSTAPPEATAEAIPPATTSPANAAPAAEQSGEILVTARRRSENISKVPISITALGGETLKQRQITTETDLQRTVPGLTIRQSGSANQFNFALRGQSVDTYSGSPPAVLTYIDEAQISQNSSGSFFDLEGIQVLKGPQGTLFGRNSTGGAILFQTARPTDKFGGYLIARYGNHDSKYLEGAVNIPLGDKAALRVAGAYTGGGAYVKNLADGKWLGKKDIKSIRGTLVLKPLDGLTNTTVVQHTSEGGNNIPTTIYSAYACGSPQFHGNNLNQTADCTYGPANSVGPAPGAWQSYINAHPDLFPGGVAAYAALQRKRGPWVADTEVPLYHRAKSTYVINTTNLELSSTLTLKNILAYSTSSANDGFDYDGTPYPIFTTQGTLNAAGTLLSDPDHNGFKPKTRQFSEEFQIQGKAFDNRLVYVLGAYYLDSTFDILSNLKGFDGLYPPTVFAYQAQQKDSSRALFAQGSYKLTDQLSFTGGFRYTWDKLTQTTGKKSAYFPGTVLYPAGKKLETLKASKPSWTVSLDYQATPSLLVYVAHRGSWRTGGFNYSTPPVPTSAATGGNTFNPETSKDVEAGLKYNGRELGVPVTFNVAVYKQWVKSVQRAAYVPGFNGPGLVTVNVPSASTFGVETDLSVRPAPWLTLGASLAYTDPKFTSNKVTLFDPVGQMPFNTFYGPVADTPKWTGTVFFDVTHDLGGDTGTLAFHGDVYAQSKFTFTNVGATLAPGAIIKGYALVNGRVSWNDMLGSKISSAFFVRNLFNKRYYTGGNSLGPTLGENTSVGGQPRMFGGELRFDF